MIYLVRHADAGLRTHHPDDRLRPLSDVGQQDAIAIAVRLGPIAEGAIMASPYVRCVETLEPLAQHRGVRVQITDELAEGASESRVLGLIREVQDSSVLCTHGDVMSVVHTAMASTGSSLTDQIHCEKGVVWVLERESDALSVVEVIHPAWVGGD